MGSFPSYSARVAIVAAIYFAAAKLGLSLAVVHGNVSLVWPPTGIALAALLFFGYRLWPGVALGAFLINASTGVGLATAGGIGAGNTLEALVGAYLLHRFAGFRNSLERLQDVLGLVTFSALLSTTISATIGVASLCLGGAAPWAVYGSLWWQWWLGDAMGALVVAPVLLAWGTNPRMSWHPRRLAEAGTLLGLLVVVSLMVFGGLFTPQATNLPFAFATFPFVIWAALRFGQREAATTTLVVSGIAIWGTWRYVGPFAGRTLTESLVVLQMFMSVVAVTALVLAAAMTQRRQMEKALQDREARVRLVLEQLPAIIWATDTGLRITLIQGAGLASANLDPRQVVGTTVREYFPDTPGAPVLAAHRRALAGEACSYEVKVQGRLFQAHVEPMRTADGAITGCLGIALDITERKEAEAAREQTNQQLTTWIMELEQRTRQITLLSEMGDLLQSCRTPQEAYTVIAQFAPKLFPTASGLLGVLGVSKNFVEAVAVWGDSPPSDRLFAPDKCWALRRGRVHLVKAPGAVVYCQHLDPSPSIGSLCVPMMAQGEPLGILHLRGSLSGEHRIEAHEQLALSMAEHIALALANLRLQETLRSQAIRDPLTGLFNRRYMEESLDREVRRAGRSKLPIGIMMLDIDHFKPLNDAFGHDAGDALLRELGRLLKAAVREGDIACRYGGEEFVFILPEADMELTRRRAEQLREEVRRLLVSHLGRVIGPVTVSVGVAAYPQHGTTGAGLLQAADAALYRAKDEGRDRVVVAG